MGQRVRVRVIVLTAPWLFVCEGRGRLPRTGGIREEDGWMFMSVRVGVVCMIHFLLLLDDHNICVW